MKVDSGMYDLLKLVYYAVSFIAVGGALALIFFLIYAQSITGSKTIHKQLENIEHNSRKILEQLKEISKTLKKSDKKD
ncbi:MAG: hypothetical protein ISS77_07365 [Phycisphaerae bacterium]|nr:hypothetical protein [Phycisphaerae bacterium]